MTPSERCARWPRRRRPRAAGAGSSKRRARARATPGARASSRRGRRPGPSPSRTGATSMTTRFRRESGQSLFPSESSARSRACTSGCFASINAP
ncbi:hypothetical protein SO694_0001016 [Aureococcus anophagefferens]|uniref:Uncharacterized protein n=1 Tax=Aureococcus anophagefferens TaxID=44056 RepID=A0ABR1GF47_AURAN